VLCTILDQIRGPEHFPYPDADTAGRSNLNCGAVLGIGGGPETAIDTRLGKHHVQGGKVSDGSPLGPQVKTSDCSRRWRQYEGVVLPSRQFLTISFSFCPLAVAAVKAKALDRPALGHSHSLIFPCPGIPIVNRHTFFFFFFFFWQRSASSYTAFFLVYISVA
jgi:hypothetical protein